MAIFKPSTWGISQVIRDLINYRDLGRSLKAERANKDSKFNKWKLQFNQFYTIYFTMDIDENEAKLPEHIKRMRIIESLANLNIYLDEELGFAECLSPEFSQFYDGEGNPTLTYLIAYRFVFNKLSIGWMIKWLFLITAPIIAIRRFEVLPAMLDFLSTMFHGIIAFI